MFVIGLKIYYFHVLIFLGLVFLRKDLHRVMHAFGHDLVGSSLVFRNKIEVRVRMY